MSNDKDLSEKSEYKNESDKKEETVEDEYIIDFVTSSAISRINLKFLIVYIPIIWISGIMALLYFWTFFDINLLIYFYNRQTFDLVIFFCLLPAHIFAIFTIFTFGCLVMSKLILLIVNLIHKPKEGIFKAELGDNDFEFWCLRIEIKKLVIWLMNNWPLPWVDVLGFKWFGIKIDSSSHLLDAWCDIEFVEFGRRVMVGQGAVIMSSMVVGKYLIIKKVIFDDHTVIGGESTIAPGTIVGKESVTGAVTCTLFNQLIEPRWVYAGIPARKLKPNDYAEKRRDIISKKHIDQDKEKIVEHEINVDEKVKDLVAQNMNEEKAETEKEKNREEKQNNGDTN